MNIVELKYNIVEQKYITPQSKPKHILVYKTKRCKTKNKNEFTHKFGKK